MRILYITLLFLSNSAFAADYEPAMMNSSGNLINGDGKVIAVPNRVDERTNQYDKYYTAVDENGQPTSESRFKVSVNPENPLAGYVQYDLNKPPEAPTNDAPAAQPQQINNGMVQTYGTTNSYNNLDLNQPRYDHNFELKPLYE